MALGKGLNSLIPQDKKARKKVRKQTSTPESQGEKLWQIPVHDIVPNPEQPRKHFDRQDLEDLVASIKKHGIMQPLTVTEKADGQFELIAGERRLRAAKIAELPTVPAVVRKATEQEKLELALIENIQRQNLNPIEEAFSYKRLINEFGLTQQDVATQVGKSRPQVANTVRLLELPDDIQKALIDGKISAGKARALLSLKDEKQQLQVFSEMIGQKVSVRDVERRVAAKGGASRKGSVRRDPNVMAQEQILEDRLGAKVRITQKGENGNITISYHGKDELRRLLEELS